MDVRTYKQGLRKEIRELKNKYSESALESMSEKVTLMLERDEHFRQAKTILMYYSLPDEVFTHRLVERYSKEKTILLPTVVGDDLELHKFISGNTLVIGSYNINESTGDLFTDYDLIDLAIIPGVAFDKSGNRLGRGKGYYDRFLPKLLCPKYGICFPFQLLDNIQSEEHDFKVDKVFC